MTPPIPWRQALWGAGAAPPALAGCEHFAGSEKLMKKSLVLQEEMAGAFDVTLDLEDGAPVGKEREQAELVVEVLRAVTAAQARVGVRIHAPQSSSWRADVATVVAGAGDRLAYLTIPKCGNLDQVRAVVAEVDHARRRAGVGSPIPLHVLIETHGALADVHAIARLPHVEVLDFGLMDFVSAHGGAIPESAMRSPGQFEHALVRRAKAEIAAAAHAAGIVPSHNVTIDLTDADKTRADAVRARDELGYLRMWSVHPVQIAVLVDVFTPSHEEVAHACAILVLAARADWGPVSHEGRLYDRASYRFYATKVERARRASVPLPPEAAILFDA